MQGWKPGNHDELNLCYGRNFGHTLSRSETKLGKSSKTILPSLSDEQLEYGTTGKDGHNVSLFNKSFNTVHNQTKGHWKTADCLTSVKSNELFPFT